MHSLQASTMMAAKPEKLWAILSEGPRYAQCNPMVGRVGGAMAKDNKITGQAKRSPGRTFPVQVTVFAARAHGLERRHAAAAVLMRRAEKEI